MKKEKKVKIETEEQKEFKKYILVVLGLVLVVVGIYFFTRAFITKDLFNKKEDTNYQTGTINDQTAIVGTMLNRPENEYYVMAFSSESNNINYYNTIVSLYTSGDTEPLKVYFVDLENSLNQKYVASDGKGSTSFESLDKLKLGEVTLLKVKDQKVTKFLTDIEAIKKELAVKKS